MTFVEQVPATPLQRQRQPTIGSEAAYLSEVSRHLEKTLLDEMADWLAMSASRCELPQELLTFVSGGKALRPRFCYWSWAATGGYKSSDAVTAGAALELLHSFALIHDDLMDRAATRRGRPSLQARFAALHDSRECLGLEQQYGESLALLTGDLSFALAYRLAAGLPNTAQQTWATLVTELVAGQYLDVSAPAHRDWSPTTAITIARLKSARYTVTGPMRLGAAINGVELDPHLNQFGDLVGEAFQLRDDVLGVFGDPVLTGKPVGEDLRSGKATLLIAEARRRVGRRRTSLLDRIGSTDLTVTEANDTADLIDRCGAREAVENRIAQCLSDGFQNLALAATTPFAKEGLSELAMAATQRSR